MNLFFYEKNFLMYLKGRHTERGREWERAFCLLFYSTSGCSGRTMPYGCKKLLQEFLPDLSYEFRGSDLGQRLSCLPRHSSWELNLK